MFPVYRGSRCWLKYSVVKIVFRPIEQDNSKYLGEERERIRRAHVCAHSSSCCVCLFVCLFVCAFFCFVEIHRKAQEYETRNLRFLSSFPEYWNVGAVNVWSSFLICRMARIQFLPHRKPSSVHYNNHLCNVIYRNDHGLFWESLRKVQNWLALLLAVLLFTAWTSRANPKARHFMFMFISPLLSFVKAGALVSSVLRDIPFCAVGKSLGSWIFSSLQIILVNLLG